MLHEIVRDTTQISSCFSDFRVVSRTIPCSITESLLHFISFLTVEEEEEEEEAGPPLSLLGHRRRGGGGTVF